MSIVPICNNTDKAESYSPVVRRFYLEEIGAEANLVEFLYPKSTQNLSRENFFTEKNS